MPTLFDLNEHSQRRLNPLTGEWIIVSPHRAKRPWKGRVEPVNDTPYPRHDPECYLCPGNVRANGDHNPQYEHTFAFDNDFPALLNDFTPGSYQPHPLIHAQSERGICRVLCFSPRHDLTMAQMDQPTVEKVVEAWTDETRMLSTHPFIGYVQIFENHRKMPGASNPHPHGQIWASERLPQQVIHEDQQQRAYFESHGRTLLEDYLAYEQAADQRIVYENGGFTALVPFWAIWPYETLIISRNPAQALTDLDADSRSMLADALRNVTARYDNMFQASFPYSMGVHQRPTGNFPDPSEKHGSTQDHWRLHLHFYPPALRSITIPKYMVGYEMLGTPQRDITPEAAADRLRELSGVRFA